MRLFFSLLLITIGTLFSANITEPHNLAEGMVNVQFTSNYIALLCPVRELSIKRWRLDHINSFGQCGGILTFECCGRCSDPNCNRASLNIVQEKPATILNMMEKSIRENPYTSEIHYERSILGDIYHCSHHCGSPRMVPAFSDSNLLSICSNSPLSSRRRNELEGSLPPTFRPEDLALEKTTSSTIDSVDSGLPGTPQLDDDSPRSSPALPSPTHFTGSHSFPPKPQEIYSPPISDQHFSRPQEARYTPMPSRSTPSDEEKEPSSPTKLTYSTILHQQGRSRDQSSSFSSNGSGSVTYSTVTATKHSERASSVQLNYTRQHSPPSSAPPPPERHQSRFRPSSTSPTSTFSCSAPKTNYGSIDSKELPYIPFDVLPPPPKVLSNRRVSSSDGNPQEDRDSLKRRELRLASVMERDHPVSELEVVEPSFSQRRTTHVVKRELPGNYERLRAHSVSDAIDYSRPSPVRSYRETSSGEDESVIGEYDNLEDLKSYDPFFRIGDLEYDETDTEGALEICSNLADYRRHTAERKQRGPSYCQPNVIDKVLSKVACDNVQGYAYKIMIPVAGDVIYDVPRRQAPVADLTSVNANPDAPPKPMRMPGKSLDVDEVFHSTGAQ